MTAPPETGIYLHWPYCARICPYCDFNVVRQREVDEARWQQVLVEDIAHYAARLGRREVVSLYFGGGTPSLMSPKLVAAIIDAVAKHFTLSEGAEITLEANPTDAEAARFQDFAAAGVGRLSLGVQSFDDGQLSFLGRNHTGEEARLALRLALATFASVTFDLIYALPNEDGPAWAMRLRDALSFDAPHLSLYQLTVEPGTAFAKAVGRGAWAPPGEDRAAALYDITQKITAAAGLPAYEVSNHAKAGHEARHNALYWQGTDWIGLGPGAAGRLTLAQGRLATLGEKRPKNYLSAPQQRRYGEEVLSTDQVVMEKLSGGLRPLTGFSLHDLPARAQEKLKPAIVRLQAEGLLSVDGNHLSIPPKGRLLVDYIVRELILSV